MALIKSSKDNRYAVDSVVTHDGIKYPCWALPNLQSFTQRLESHAYNKVYLLSLLITLFNFIIIQSSIIFFCFKFNYVDLTFCISQVYFILLCQSLEISHTCLLYGEAGHVECRSPVVCTSDQTYSVYLFGRT